MKILVLFSLLVLAGCASIAPISETTPEQAEQMNYVRSVKSESAPLVRIDQLQMNNASKVPRAN